MASDIITVSHDVIRNSDGAAVGVIDSRWYSPGALECGDDGFPIGAVLRGIETFGNIPACVTVWHFDVGYGKVNVETVKRDASRYTLRPRIS